MIDRILGGSFSPYDKEPLVYDVFFSLWRYRIQIAEGRVKSFLSVAAQNRAKTFLLHRGREIPTFYFVKYFFPSTMQMPL